VRVDVTGDFAIGFAMTSEGFSRGFAGKSRVLARVSGAILGLWRRGGFVGFVCWIGAGGGAESVFLGL
jgi:hypothetical protein